MTFCPLIVYIQFHAEKRKLIYCSRTVPEIEKALAELRRLMEYRVSEGMQEDDFLGIGLTSRKNLCIHPTIAKEKKGKAVDARCRDITNAAVCEKGRNDPGSVELCDWHEVCSISSTSGIHSHYSCQRLGEREPGQLFPNGVWTLEDIKAYGIREGICPYFAVRRMVRNSCTVGSVSLNLFLSCPT